MTKTRGLFFPYQGELFNDSAGLIDSGSVFCLFKQEIAQALNITIEEGETTQLYGVGGTIKAYIHRLKLIIAYKELLCPVVFSKDYHVAFNLLGRRGFFEKFAIIFEEKQKRVGLK